MLQQIREKFTGLFAVILLGMIGVSFIFFGVGNFQFLNAGNAAVVEDVEISVFALESAFQNQLLELPNYSDLPPESLQILRRNALERLIREALLEVYVAREGYRVGDEQVAELIQSEPTFQTDGVFDKELYYQWLDQMVMDARVFEARQRAGMRTSQVQRGIVATSFITPSDYRRYLNLYAEQRVASLATFDIAALAETIVVRDEDVQAYYDARPDAFRAPESVDFQYLEVNRTALGEDVEIADDVLQQYYEDNSGRFLQDEQRRASHILITTEDGEEAAEEMARSLTIRAQSGEPWNDLTRQYSKDTGSAERGGDLGTILQSQMPGALGDAIFSLNQGEIFGPVRTDFGFHVVRLDEIVQGGPLPLDQVRGELLAELRSQGVDDQFLSLQRQMGDAVFDATDLSSVAEATGLELMTATGFTRNGGEPFGANQSVIDAVFDPLVLNEGQISDVVEIDVDRSVMVMVSEYREEARRPLEEVREDIIFALQSERALNIIEDRSRRLLEALEEGREFEEMAFELEAEFQPDLTLERLDESIDLAVLDAIYRAKKPTPGKGRMGSTVTTEGDYVVFMLKAVLPGRPESIPLDQRDQRKEQLQMAAGARDYNAFINELERTSDIERNEEAIAGPEFLQ